jgi:uncharacterized protein (DUF1330 family)
MSAYLVAHISIKGMKKWNQYVNKVPQILEKYGGNLVFKRRLDKVFCGNHSYDICAIIWFLDAQSLNRWYYSSEYQDLVPIRDEAANVNFLSYSDK